MAVQLITIPFSHYCEKARWALDRCGVPFTEEAHLPIFHRAATRRVRAGRTVPAVVEGTTVVGDSTDIVAWADARRPGALLPEAPVRAEALALEDDFDRQFGPATRRWAYFHLLPKPELMAEMAPTVPRWQLRALRVTRPLAVAIMRRAMNIDAAGAERSRVKIEQAFERVAGLLADGRRYLAGDRFSVADLAFAALAAPVVLPPEMPVAMPTVEQFPDAGGAQIRAWRQTPAGQFALRMYREHRR